MISRGMVVRVGDGRREVDGVDVVFVKEVADCYVCPRNDDNLRSSTFYSRRVACRPYLAVNWRALRQELQAVCRPSPSGELIIIISPLSQQSDR